MRQPPLLKMIQLRGQGIVQLGQRLAGVFGMQLGEDFAQAFGGEQVAGRGLEFRNAIGVQRENFARLEIVFPAGDRFGLDA